MDEFAAYGNKGGDRLEMRVLSQDDDTAMIHLRVGSCCVYSINHIVPVELLTSLLTIALGYGDVREKAPEWLEWSNEVNQHILNGISRWQEFDDWWFNVRPSNTEPLLRLNLEAKTKKLMEKKRDEILKIIRS